jgi:hypothetical protein
MSGTTASHQVDNMTANVADPDQHLQNVIKDVRCDALYLGNASLLDNVHWVDDGRRRVLAENAEDIENEVAEPAILKVIGVITRPPRSKRRRREGGFDHCPQQIVSDSN